MNFRFVGELAALTTAFCWAVTGIFFTIGGRRIGSHAVNLLRLLMALVAMLAIHRLWVGEWIPLDAGRERWGWLALSGVIGLALGDASLFQALVSIGPRLTTLLMATVPLLTTLLSWVLLGERLDRIEYLSVPLTVGGVAWVVLERTGDSSQTAGRRDFRRGILFGLGGALGQSLGLITSRLGLEGDFPVVSANLIRTLAAVGALWIPSLFAGLGARTLQFVQADRRVLLPIVGGAIAGPVVGVMLSLLAVQRAPVGVASTLMSLTPIIMLPLVRFVFGEHISRRALGGTLLALLGATLIFLT